MKKRILSFVFAAILLISGANVTLANNDNVVVSLGKDLNSKQRSDMLNYFNVDESARIIEVTNAEEREYFGEHIDSSLIGTRSISSAYVEKLEEGEGITVSSNNITWVTNDMYRNALVTAGIEDANIKVSSPVNVSGTAALTGIMKAFEDASGKKISEKEKQTASEEIAKTASLGNEIGKEKAEELMNNIKIYIVDNNITNTGDIKKVIEDMSGDLNIELTEEQKDQIASLMKKISSLDLNIGNIKNQLKDVSAKIDKIIDQNVELKSFFGNLMDNIKGFFSKASDFVSNLFN